MDMLSRAYDTTATALSMHSLHNDETGKDRFIYQQYRVTTRTLFFHTQRLSPDTIRDLDIGDRFFYELLWRKTVISYSLTTIVPCSNVKSTFLCYSCQSSRLLISYVVIGSNLSHCEGLFLLSLNASIWASILLCIFPLS